MNKEDVAMKLINLIEEKLESMQWDTIRGGVVEQECLSVMNQKQGF